MLALLDLKECRQPPFGSAIVQHRNEAPPPAEGPRPAAATLIDMYARSLTSVMLDL